jgi:quinolinate synthase
MSTTVGARAAEPLHPLADYQQLTDAALDARIEAARGRLGSRLVILGHHYQRDEVVKHADFLGDSFGLSQKAAATSAEFIVFCGVHFMAESADVLAQPEQRVILPDLGAGCSMADMADLDEVEEAWAELTELLGDTVVPLTYMNSTAAIKAFCGRNGGLVCTSSNAPAAFRWAWEQKRTLLFLPDEHLGRNTGTGLGVTLDKICVWDPRLPVEKARAQILDETPLVLWRGYCSVHQRFTPQQAEWARKEFPGLKVIVHPECKYEVCQAADFVGSTDFILRTVNGAPAGSKWAVGTEIHLVHRLAKQNPDKLVISLQTNVCACATMYRIDPIHLGWVLENLADGVVVNEIKVDDETVKWARVALERMLEVGVMEAPQMGASEPVVD